MNSSLIISRWFFSSSLSYEGVVTRERGYWSLCLSRSHPSSATCEFVLRLALTWHLRNRMWTFVLMGAIGSCIVSYTLRCFIIFIRDLFCEIKARNSEDIIALFYYRTCRIFDKMLFTRIRLYWSSIFFCMKHNASVTKVRIIKKYIR